MRARTVWSIDRGNPLPLGSPHPALRATFPQGGKAFDGGNCRSSNNHQGSARSRGNRGTVTPLLRQKNQATPEQQDEQYQETKESLEPWF